MAEYQFTWDESKNKINKSKHKVSFEEAKTVFFDDFSRLIYDPEHSIEEDRFILLGMSNVHNILIIVHCFKESENIIRIISARKATMHETEEYWRFQS